MSTVVQIWEGPSAPATLPSSASFEVIAARAIQLTPRERNSIVSAMNAQSFEMASTFVWARAMAALKKQLAHLGTDFVGEMLGRTDITAESPIENVVTDYDAVNLASDLGMISPTEAMRLRHALESVHHFASRDSAGAQDEMTQEEAVGCLRACVQTVLSQEKVEVAIKFAEFRRELQTRNLTAEDPKLLQLAASPYLFQRTTLSVLLSLAKTARAPALEFALANLNVILPLLWAGLREPERHQTGETYTYTYSAGNMTAAAGVKLALLKVRGFDYVPETLRSETFVKAAAAVIQAHEGWNNFTAEPPAVKALATLGTSIPIRALPQCMTAVLCVKLGNRYGESWSAQETATQILRGVSADRWTYYLNECLPGDRRILDKLYEEKPRRKWMSVVAEFGLNTLEVKNGLVKRLLVPTSAPTDEKHIWPAAMKLIAQYRGVP